MRLIDMHTQPDYLPPATGYPVVGFDSLSGAAMSRNVFALRLFRALVRPVLGGRAGEPKGSLVLHQSVNPVRSPSRLTAGMAATYRNWSTTMPNVAALRKKLQAVDAATLAKSCFYDLSALFAAIRELSDEHSIANSLAKTGQYLADDWGDLHARQCEVFAAELASLPANA